MTATVRPEDAPLPDFRRFVAQITPERWQRIGPWLLLLILVCVADACSTFGDDLPVLTNVIVGVLLLGLTITLVEEYLAFRARERWSAVAAFALEDLMRVTRAVWVKNGHLIQPPLETLGVEQFRVQVASAEGREQQRAALLELLSTPAGRQRAYDELHETAGRTREVIIAWAPTMVSQERLAPALASLADVHRQMVRVLQFLHRERAGGELPIAPEDLATLLLEIQSRASDLDVEFGRAAGAINQLPGTALGRR